MKRFFAFVALLLWFVCTIAAFTLAYTLGWLTRSTLADQGYTLLLNDRSTWCRWGRTLGDVLD